MATISYTPTEEQELLRKTARRFLSERAGTDVVRKLMDTDTAHDADLWAEAAGLGWHGLAIPEAYGGAGYSLAELAIVLHEQGRAVFPGPFFATVVLGANAILAAGTEAQKQAHLPAIAAGERTATLALLETGHGLAEGDVALAASRSGDGWALTGNKRFVLDGGVADLLVVAARTDDGVRLFLVDGDAEGVTRTGTPTMDATRKQADIRFDAASGEIMDGGWDAVEHVLRVASAGLATELTGVAERSLEMALEYARTRYQFGRPIGSFQAVKHRLADMLMKTESSRSAALHAVRVADDPTEFAIAAPLAKAVAATAVTWITGELVQVHGGIGFTWEHDAHLYLKRAKAASLLFGDARHQRRHLADALGL